jgi:hypothetical protein
MGEARGRPYDLDACGSLASTDERSSVALQSIRRSLVSAGPTEPQRVQVEMVANARRGMQKEACRPPFDSVPVSLSLHVPYQGVRMPGDRPERVALARKQSPTLV